MNQTRLTYTPIPLNGFPNALVEPPHIDVTEFPNTPNEQVHRYRTRLQNTFMVDGTIIAVWVIDVYLGQVEGKVNPGNKPSDIPRNIESFPSACSECHWITDPILGPADLVSHKPGCPKIGNDERHVIWLKNSHGNTD